MNIRSAILVLLCTAACTTTGAFEGDVASPPSDGLPITTAPPPAHEHVEFTWTSLDGGLSGDMHAALPDGKAFDGEFREITRMTRSTTIDGFYGGWYGGWWYGPRWTWGGMYPYYPTDTFLVEYTGKVLAILDDHEGVHMRCRFELLDGNDGIGSGGDGECQLSNGERITAYFGPNRTST